ncbi:type II secretion system protein [bacterium]|nr:type II secretion system protein [bacterium]
MLVYKNKFAFTVAELLLVIVIVGIIAALTIPQITYYANKNAYRTALKKAISVSNNALKKHYSLTNLTASDYSSEEELVDEIFKTQMNVMGNINEFTSKDCSGTVFGTSDGIIYCVQNFYSDITGTHNNECNIFNTKPCTKDEGANLLIDVNGYKKPNMNTISAVHPKDIYQAQIYSQKIVPYGEPTVNFMYGSENDSVINPDDTPTISQSEPQNPSYNDEPPENIKPDDIPEDYYNQYDENKWPSWLEFLRWLLRLLGRIFFGN